MIECQVRYIVNCLRMLPGEVEATPEAMRGYQRWLDRMVTATVWPMGCVSWYKTSTGRVTNPWPASTMRYWYLTRQHPGRAFLRSR